ncbi:uncharacterized protein J3D65DRAFT_410017 [Phyllosticta citribraziliensis]|uniref:Uncharacterized protein n=1 Tax=Phyllosticta citribraziliensis TaxID=989973 RepID=A0ABR1LM18_9PEZI
MNKSHSSVTTRPTGLEPFARVPHPATVIPHGNYSLPYSPIFSLCFSLSHTVLSYITCFLCPTPVHLPLLDSLSEKEMKVASLVARAAPVALFFFVLAAVLLHCIRFGFGFDPLSFVRRSGVRSVGYRLDWTGLGLGQLDWMAWDWIGKAVVWIWSCLLPLLRPNHHFKPICSARSCV